MSRSSVVARSDGWRAADRRRNVALERIAAVLEARLPVVDVRPCARCGDRLVVGSAEDLVCCERCALAVQADLLAEAEAKLDAVRAQCAEPWDRLQVEYVEGVVTEVDVVTVDALRTALGDPTPQTPLPGRTASAASTHLPPRDPARPHTPTGQGRTTTTRGGGS